MVNVRWTVGWTGLEAKFCGTQEHRTVVSRSWVDEYFPEKELKGVLELFGHELFLTVANNTRLDYVGYIEVVFKMGEGAEPVLVPFLVIEEEMEMPLIGNNAIEEVVRKEKESADKEKLIEMLEDSLEVTKKNAKAIVNLIEKRTDDAGNESLGDLKIWGRDRDVVVPRGCNMKLKCVTHCGPVEEDTAVIFQPNLQLDLAHELVVGEGIVMLERKNEGSCSSE